VHSPLKETNRAASVLSSVSQTAATITGQSYGTVSAARGLRCTCVVVISMYDMLPVEAEEKISIV